jgi:predicted amidohydrolase
VLRVSVLELPATWGRTEAALREVEDLIAMAATDLAILPELSLCGYVSPEANFDPTRFSEPLDGATMRAIQGICKRRGVHIVAPLVLREHSRFYNAAVAMSEAGAIATYKKRHPWFPERWATPGTSPPPLFEIGGIKATMAICYDGHFLAEDAREILANVDLLVFTSAWVDVPPEPPDLSREGGEDSRMPLLRDLARRFHISIANANWGPGVVEVAGQGGSCIMNAEGVVLASVKARGAPRDRRADASIAPGERRQ